MQKSGWQIQAFYLWDALICNLRRVADVGFHSTPELNAS
ncbi:Fungal specific transcription factor, putative [Penicillium digitatum PHI26]|uniref:Fungal specific transcription factor, putative n=2 Tax=Penicillium digitatum TaxID=36651 RepID=K9G8P2_PEND2|nr:Fungal specific transcription factor, putative [Penicillium digitatum Pd1]EKV08080.1 Fungal specific transcription factor, putative [Penicillium digitatum Pd1]EKV09621.1 Fungal specific transcription factor, putative [Penicillium digitatum PHI26]